MDIVIYFLIFLLFLAFTIVLIELVYAILHHKAIKWIKLRSSEINDEMCKISCRLIENNNQAYAIRFLLIKRNGMYISTRGLDKKRTKPLSAIQIQKIIFNMYNTPYNDVLEPYFMDYENKQLELLNEENKKRFSGNKYKRAIKFKPANEE